MSRKKNIYEKAKKTPNNLTYNELCWLAEKVGFVFRNQKGSHKIYKHPILRKTLNFQPDKRDKSKAKIYQIDQLINFIDENDLIG